MAVYYHGFPDDVLLDEKETLLDDISKAFKEGSFNDVTFILADNSVISTNKFMLACRVPYFATMLFGGFAADLTEDPITLNCCNSSTFKRILQFVFEGEITFNGMTMESLLELLETSRFLCLDIICEAVQMFLDDLIYLDEIEFRDCLVALDFSILHKFEESTEMFLEYIDENLSRISCLPEFQTLTEASIKMLIQREDSVATEIERFRALANWFEANMVEVNVKNEMLSQFDVNKFKKDDLVYIAREAQLIEADKDVCVELVKHLNKLEDWMKDVIDQMDGQMNKFLKCHEDTLPNLSEIFLLRMSSDKVKSNTSVWKIPEEYETYFINKLDFAIWRSSLRYSYILKSSQDGESWSNIATFTDVPFQQVSFEKRKIKYLGIVVTRCNDPWIDFKPDIRSVEASGTKDLRSNVGF